MTAKNNRLDPGFWIGLVLIAVVLAIFPIRCKAQDTIPCRNECIQKVLEFPTVKGDRTKLYVVYVDEKNDIQDLIPVSRSVYDYMNLCKDNGVKPTLGIRIKNGQIVSIVKYKRKYGKK